MSWKDKQDEEHSILNHNMHNWTAESRIFWKALSTDMGYFNTKTGYFNLQKSYLSVLSEFGEK